jgi:hypothetical protein
MRLFIQLGIEAALAVHQFDLDSQACSDFLGCLLRYQLSLASRMAQFPKRPLTTTALHCSSPIIVFGSAWPDRAIRATVLRVEQAAHVGGHGTSGGDCQPSGSDVVSSSGIVSSNTAAAEAGCSDKLHSTRPMPQALRAAGHALWPCVKPHGKTQAAPCIGEIQMLLSEVLECWCRLCNVSHQGSGCLSSLVNYPRRDS